MPTVFLSYRHVVSPDNPDKNVEYILWIEKLVADLEQRGIFVVWDRRLNEAIASVTSFSPSRMPFCGEVSSALAIPCGAFVPIITTYYLERIGLNEGTNSNSVEYGTVFEEVQLALWLRRGRLTTIIPVLKDVQDDQMSAHWEPSLFECEVIDLRSTHGEQYEKRLDLFSAYLRGQQLGDSWGAYHEIHILAFVKLYQEWSKYKYHYRRFVPFEAWWYRTDAIYKFLAEVGPQIGLYPGWGTPSGEFFDALAARYADMNSSSESVIDANDLIQLLKIEFDQITTAEEWQRAELAARSCKLMLSEQRVQGEKEDLEYMSRLLDAALVRIT